MRPDDDGLLQPLVTYTWGLGEPFPDAIERAAYDARGRLRREIYRRWSLESQDILPIGEVGVVISARDQVEAYRSIERWPYPEYTTSPAIDQRTQGDPRRYFRMMIDHYGISASDDWLVEEVLMESMLMGISDGHELDTKAAELDHRG